MLQLMFFFIDSLSGCNQIKMDLLMLKRLLSGLLSSISIILSCYMITSKNIYNNVVNSKEPLNHVNDIRKVFIKCKQYELRTNL